jgi:hypothetical protein
VVHLLDDCHGESKGVAAVAVVGGPGSVRYPLEPQLAAYCLVLMRAFIIQINIAGAS